jgi:SAM-dependent methyltransferase
MRCLVCSGNDWRPLPIPVSGQSISTAGIVFRQPLEREQCMTCGLLQKKNQNFVGHSRFYEEQYENYYKRPISEKFDRGRYVAMARWTASALGDGFVPRSVLDVGCGAGWSMQATRDVYSDAAISGIEPSAINAQKAREGGFDVTEARLSDVPRDRRHDLIYSNNVLQHVTEPAGFFRDLAALLADEGRIVLVLPDASEPSHEMMWCDQNFSFRPKDLAGLAEQAGLHLHAWQPNPKVDALLNKQLVVLGRSSAAHHVDWPASPAAETLFARRSAYMASWRDLDAELMRRASGHVRLFNFGASMWSWLLAGYCPDYWRSVEACLVDGGGGKCVDKSVLSPADIAFAKGDCIVLGINPVTQQALATRLRERGPAIVSWSDRIVC